jgi:alginate O-acetyltransferase complex protein AlgI
MPWLTDYVFTPLRMSTRRMGTAGLVASLMMTFVLVGIGHGFTLPFLVFGIVHGVFMTVSPLTLNARDRFYSTTAPASGWPVPRRGL